MNHRTPITLLVLTLTLTACTKPTTPTACPTKGGVTRSTSSLLDDRRYLNQYVCKDGSAESEVSERPVSAVGDVGGGLAA